MDTSSSRERPTILIISTATLVGESNLQHLLAPNCQQFFLDLDTFIHPTPFIIFALVSKALLLDTWIIPFCPSMKKLWNFLNILVVLYVFTIGNYSFGFVFFFWMWQCWAEYRGPWKGWRTVLPALPWQDGHTHMWCLPPAHRGACGSCSGQDMACGGLCLLFLCSAWYVHHACYNVLGKTWHVEVCVCCCHTQDNVSTMPVIHVVSHLI